LNVSNYTKPNCVPAVWAKWASFYGLCFEQIFIKSTRHLKTTFYSQAKMLGGLCASKV
jgi:hypothetical protein